MTSRAILADLGLSGPPLTYDGLDPVVAAATLAERRTILAYIEASASRSRSRGTARALRVVAGDIAAGLHEERAGA